MEREELINCVTQVCEKRGWDDNDEKILLSILELLNGIPISKVKRMTMEINELIGKTTMVIYPFDS